MRLELALSDLVKSAWSQIHNDDAKLTFSCLTRRARAAVRLIGGGVYIQNGVEQWVYPPKAKRSKR